MQAACTHRSPYAQATRTCRSPHAQITRTVQEFNAQSPARAGLHLLPPGRGEEPLSPGDLIKHKNVPLHRCPKTFHNVFTQHGKYFKGGEATLVKSQVQHS